MMERMSSPAETTMQLFDQLRAPLLRYLISLRLSIPDAEEIVQDVFLALYRHLRERKPESNLRAWAFAVAHNQGLKSRMRTRRMSAPGGAPPEETADESPDPEEMFASQQRQDQLRAIVRALPEQDQWCLTLRAEGLRYREIAEVLGVSLGTVANSLERSIARLTRADSARLTRVDRRTYATRG
jgi:RNA polymerase sigma-70 factor (ECF subfamily)